MGGLFGGGGGYDTSGLERATREANELQRQIYEESIQRGQPFYDVGVSGLGTLADYLGLSGGSNRSRQQIYDDLLPQYTQQLTTSMPGSYVTPEGNIVTDQYILSQAASPGTPGSPTIGDVYNNALTADVAQRYGYSPYQTTGSQVDYDALNMAVDEAFGAQQTPDYYGTLLQGFGEEQFREDPGYQFRKSEGEKAIERQLAAQGKTFTPEAIKALSEYNQGIADQAYTDAFNRYNIEQDNIFNRLASIAGMGQTQTGQMAGLGQSYAGAVGQNLGNLATAQSQAQQAAQANRGSMFNTLLGLGSSIALAPTTGGGSLIGGFLG